MDHKNNTLPNCIARVVWYNRVEETEFLSRNSVSRNPGKETT
jgi:hypothetical protein